MTMIEQRPLAWFERGGQRLEVFREIDHAGLIFAGYIDGELRTLGESKGEACRLLLKWQPQRI